MDDRFSDTIRALGAAFLVDRVALVKTTRKGDGADAYMLCITQETPERAPSEDHVAFDLIPVAEVILPAEARDRFERPAEDDASGILFIKTGLREALAEVSV